MSYKLRDQVVTSRNSQLLKLPLQHQVSRLCRSAGKNDLIKISAGRNYTATEKKDLEEFASDKYREYFVYPRLETQAIGLFVEALNIYARVISDRNFDMKKQALTTSPRQGSFHILPEY